MLILCDGIDCSLTAGFLGHPGVVACTCASTPDATLSTFPTYGIGSPDIAQLDESEHVSGSSHCMGLMGIIGVARHMGGQIKYWIACDNMFGCSWEVWHMSNTHDQRGARKPITNKVCEFAHAAFECATTAEHKAAGCPGLLHGFLVDCASSESPCGGSTLRAGGISLDRHRSYMSALLLVRRAPWQGIAYPWPHARGRARPQPTRAQEPAHASPHAQTCSGDRTSMSRLPPVSSAPIWLQSRQ